MECPNHRNCRHNKFGDTAESRGEPPRHSAAPDKSVEMGGMDGSKCSHNHSCSDSHDIAGRNFFAEHGLAGTALEQYNDRGGYVGGAQTVDRRHASEVGRKQRPERTSQQIPGGGKIFSS